MRCLIVHNLASGPHSDEIFTFIHALLATGDEVVMRCIGEALETEEAVADARSFDRIVVSGGDGTVANVLDHLRDCGVPILVFPSGTANLYFQNVGNAPDAAALAQACRAGITAKVDMGELFWVDESGETRRHGFINIAGSGFDATIMEKAAPTKNDIGEIAYVLSALSTPEPQVAHFTIEHDGEVDELDGISCMVGNTASIQNEINLFPDCRMDDGLIDIAVVEPTTLVGLLGSGGRSSRPSRRKPPRLPARPHSACSSTARSYPITRACLAPECCRNASISSLTSSRTSALIPKSSSARASYAPCCRATSGYHVRSRAIFGHCTRLWATSGRFRPSRWKNLARRRRLRPDVARRR